MRRDETIWGEIWRGVQRDIVRCSSCLGGVSMMPGGIRLSLGGASLMPGGSQLDACRCLEGDRSMPWGVSSGVLWFLSATPNACAGSEKRQKSFRCNLKSSFESCYRVSSSFESCAVVCARVECVRAGGREGEGERWREYREKRERGTSKLGEGGVRRARGCERRGVRVASASLLTAAPRLAE